MEGERKSSKSPMAMRLAGLLCLSVATWLVLSGSLGKGKKMAAFGNVDISRHPLVTKHSIRSSAAPLTEEAVREKFSAARKRGITRQEVGWIVEDFAAAGLNRELPESLTVDGYMRLRLQRQKWYLDLLTSGFDLTKEQKFQMDTSLRIQAKNDLSNFTDFLEKASKFESKGKQFIVFDGSKGRLLIDAEQWLENSERAPWNLVKLSKEQMEMTGPGVEAREKIWKGEILGAWDNGGGNTEDSELIQNGKIPMIPIILASAGKIFPMDKGQLSGIQGVDGKSLLDQVKFLIPAQLKTFLLFHPEKAEVIRGEIETIPSDKEK